MLNGFKLENFISSYETFSVNKNNCSHRIINFYFTVANTLRRMMGKITHQGKFCVTKMRNEDIKYGKFTESYFYELIKNCTKNENYSLNKKYLKIKTAENEF